MKLSELLTIIFKSGLFQTENNDVDYRISGEVLKMYKEELLKCDEFKEVLDIEFINSPVIEKNGKSLLTQNFVLKEGSELKGNVILYSIYLSPEMYDPEEFNLTNLTNEITICPIFYNPVNFLPKKSVTINFNPDNFKDQFLLGETKQRKILHDLLDNALDNPKDYEIKSHRGITIRGIFGINTVNGDKYEKVIL
jgi:hypothetical protein